MPIFGGRFSPKKTPSRKSTVSLNTEEPLENLVEENRTVKLKLGDQESYFENGVWVQDNGDSGYQNKYHQRLKSKIQELEEENNLLKLKYEILINMVTQSTAENHQQQREIHRLKKHKK